MLKCFAEHVSLNNKKINPDRPIIKLTAQTPTMGLMKMDKLSVTSTANLLGPVVQSIVSQTTSLRRQLIKYMPTKFSNAHLFFVGKM